MPDDLANWLRVQLDEHLQRNEGSGIAARLTYLDEHGRLLYTTVASATEVDPERWTIADDDAPAGWARVTIIHDERAVRDDLAAKRAILDTHEHHRDYVSMRAMSQLPNQDTVAGIWRCIACRPANGAPPDQGWCMTVRELGWPYGNQPGYSDEWRP
jgi:hypothetical protein